MKKYIVTLTAFALLSVGMVGQAFASSIHTVEKGETLWVNFTTKERKYTRITSMEQSKIQQLYILLKRLKVEEVSTSKTHIVVSGDTLFSIAQKYNLSVDGLMNSNQLTSDLIHPGDELVLEGTKAAVAGVNTTSESF